MLLDILEPNLGLKSDAVKKLVTYGTKQVVDCVFVPVYAQQSLGKLEEAEKELYEEMRLTLNTSVMALAEFEKYYCLLRPLLPTKSMIPKGKILLYADRLALKLCYQILISIYEAIIEKVKYPVNAQDEDNLKEYGGLAQTMTLVHSLRNCVFVILGGYLPLERLKGISAVCTPTLDRLMNLVNRVLSCELIMNEYIIRDLEEIFEENLTLRLIKDLNDFILNYKPEKEKGEEEEEDEDEYEVCKY